MKLQESKYLCKIVCVLHSLTLNNYLPIILAIAVKADVTSCGRFLLR